MIKVTKIQRGCLNKTTDMLETLIAIEQTHTNFIMNVFQRKVHQSFKQRGEQ